MGKLKELIEEYKKTPVNTPRDREIVEAMKKIVESDWWDKTVGEKFKWPTKWNGKYRRFGFELDEFCYIGNFIVPIDQKDLYIKILTGNRDA